MVRQYCTISDSTHVEVIVQILRYLNSIPYHSLIDIKSRLGFMSYTDIGWRSTGDGRQSTVGWLFVMGEAHIS